MAFLRRRSPARFARRARILLRVSCAVYIVILVPPISDISKIGEGDRAVNWNPFVSYEEEQSDELEGSYVPLPDIDDTYVYYGAQELSREQAEEARHQADPSDAAYYRYPLAGGGAVWFDSHGRDLDTETRAELSEQNPPKEYVSVHDATEGLVAAEKILNLLIFIPIGIVAFASFSSWWARLCVGPVLSVAVETGQWLMSAGRVSETADVIVNSAGHIVGVLMAAVSAMLVGRLAARSPKRLDR
ncbi:VanZ family protein [Nocardiopsis gilva]